jgi:hypothetical protein
VCTVCASAVLHACSKRSVLCIKQHCIVCYDDVYLLIALSTGSACWRAAKLVYAVGVLMKLATAATMLSLATGALGEASLLLARLKRVALRI